MEYVSKLANELKSELDIVSKIGEGVSSRVYLVIHNKEKKVLKVSKKSLADYYREGNSCPLEYDILTRFKHKYLLEVEHIYAKLRYNGVVLLMPCYPMNYANYIENSINNPLEKLTICYKIMEASKFLFNNGILHLDIKPDNILLDKDNNPVLADFDIAVKIDSTKSMISLERDVIALQIRPYELLVRNNNLIGEHTLVHKLGYLIYMSFMTKLYNPPNRQHMKKYVEDNYNEIEIKNTILKTIGEDIKDKKILNLVVDLLCNTITPIVGKRYSLEKMFDHPLWNLIYKEEVKGNVIEPEAPEYIECNNSINRIFNHNLIYYEKHFMCYDLPSNILFQAIDLFYRSIHLIEDKRNKNIISLEIACTFIAWKLFSGYMIQERLKVDDFILANPYSLLANISDIDILNTENEIITHLKGQLCRTFIYESLTDENTFHILNNVLFDYEKYKSFTVNRVENSRRKNLHRLLLLKEIKI